MDKAILVIDMPESCDKCPLLFRHEEERCCWVEGRNSFTTKPDWCPLKSIPNKRKEKYAADVGLRDSGFIDGWNACIDEILWQ